MAFKNIKTSDQLLAELREKKREEINAIRDMKETEGFTFNGTVFQSDQRSVERMAVASNAAISAILTNQPFQLVWRAADNSEHALDANGVLALTVALATHGNQLHETAKQLKSQVDSAATAEDVKGVEWPM